MDENEVILEIAKTTSRTEERARVIERDIRDLKERYVAESEARDERISAVEDRVEKHELIVGGMVFTVGTAVTAFFGKVMGFIKW